MKRTITLISVLLILILIKIFLFQNPIIKENIDLTEFSKLEQATNKTVLLEQENGIYQIKLVYTVLYDETTKGLIELYQNGYENRLSLFEDLIETESEQKINVETQLEFLNIKTIGKDKLIYDWNIDQWIRTLSKHYEHMDYNTIVFVPILETKWCMDGLSQGFNYKSDVFFCMEEFFNPKNNIENQGAIGLMTHKFLHGYGFNHQNQMYKQYALLDWYQGLPETNILLHGNFRDYKAPFLDEYNLKVLNIINRTKYETNCLDVEGYKCESENLFFCKDSWGPFCQDIDKDDIVDNEDTYVFSSPKKGNDSDGDGIIDSLDLCNWNKIKVNNKEIPLKIESDLSSQKLQFSGKNIIIKEISGEPMIMRGGFIFFNETNAEISKTNSIQLSSKNKLWRIKVNYKYQNKEYYRSYYLYFKGFGADFVYEKEWFYFNRFGCDTPIEVDFRKQETYDSDKNLIPDEELFFWMKNLTTNYDWDGDAISDLEDSLPTVTGNCSYKNIQGVKDSDEDGFCDPGVIDLESKRVHFFELGTKILWPELVDECPYKAGKNRGC